MTFAEWVTRWEVGLHDLRPTTRELNLGVVRNHLLPRFGGWPLARIATSDVAGMVTADIAAGLSSSTVRRHVIVLRLVLEAAVVDGRIGRNPCVGVKLPPERSRDMRVLDAGQVHELARVFGDHYGSLIYTAAYVGLRWGELAGLRVTKVDPLRRTILVDEQLLDVNGKLSWGPPKTRAGVRTVTMPGAVAELLGSHLATLPVRRSGLVFPTVTGLPRRPVELPQTLAPARRSEIQRNRPPDAGVPRAPPHRRVARDRRRRAPVDGQGAARTLDDQRDDRPLRAHVPGAGSSTRRGAGPHVPRLACGTDAA